MNAEDTKPKGSTVTLTFITNHEVDVEKVDLRYNDLRGQLVSAIVPGTASPQEILATDGESLESHRRKIREVKHGG